MLRACDWRKRVVFVVGKKRRQFEMAVLWHGEEGEREEGEREEGEGEEGVTEEGAGEEGEGEEGEEEELAEEERAEEEELWWSLHPLNAIKRAGQQQGSSRAAGICPHPAARG